MLRPVERFAVDVPVGQPRPASPPFPSGGRGGGDVLWPVSAMAALGVLLGLLLPAA